ncbi:hypothetical protein N4G70_35120 [Streptomyces sp. ASQP_92]|uniref:hypothetical protein n=1 Tax=Streptomyces sp. ASQP_92 TaxID=2979116 RepID=UPI0021C23046|nr:hypothetical protein [Streptomyces sp. ASQP_92]MCT9094049.1 hypothetical protein [Streptomyces sp. ASQP_92]
MDREVAEQRAARFLAERSQAWLSSKVRIIVEDCFIDADRLLAPYDRIEFLDEGDEDAQLGGNLPIRVDLKTGECSFVTWEELDDFMERGLF